MYFSLKGSPVQYCQNKFLCFALSNEALPKLSLSLQYKLHHDLSKTCRCQKAYMGLYLTPLQIEEESLGAKRLIWACM